MVLWPQERHGTGSVLNPLLSGFEGFAHWKALLLIEFGGLPYAVSIIEQDLLQSTLMKKQSSEKKGEASMVTHDESTKFAKMANQLPQPVTKVMKTELQKVIKDCQQKF